MERMYLAIVLCPLVAAVVAGLFGRQIGRSGAHTITILGVGAAFVMSLLVLKAQWFDGAPAFNGAVYTWAVVDGVTMDVGFLVDRLTALMMVKEKFYVDVINRLHEAERDAGVDEGSCGTKNAPGSNVITFLKPMARKT